MFLGTNVDRKKRKTARVASAAESTTKADAKGAKHTVQNLQHPYSWDGRIISNKLEAVYECNINCRCHVRQCTSRVVTRGPWAMLQVFRTKHMGWGLRCLNHIPAGTFIAEYIGEIACRCYLIATMRCLNNNTHIGEVLLEEDAEKRGREMGDEYLFQLDLVAAEEG
jgi:hypothetical protein